MNLPTWETVDRVTQLWSAGSVNDGVLLAQTGCNQITEFFDDLSQIPDGILAIFSVLCMQSGSVGSDHALAESPSLGSYLDSADVPDAWRDQLRMRYDIRVYLDSIPQVSSMDASITMQRFWMGKVGISDAIVSLLHVSPSKVTWWIDDFEFSADNLATLFLTTFAFGPTSESEMLRTSAFESTIQLLNSLVSWPSAQDFGTLVESV